MPTESTTRAERLAPSELSRSGMAHSLLHLEPAPPIRADSAQCRARFAWKRCFSAPFSPALELLQQLGVRHGPACSSAGGRRLGRSSPSLAGLVGCGFLCPRPWALRLCRGGCCRRRTCRSRNAGIHRLAGRVAPGEAGAALAEPADAAGQLAMNPRLGVARAPPTEMVPFRPSPASHRPVGTMAEARQVRWFGSPAA